MNQNMESQFFEKQFTFSFYLLPVFKNIKRNYNEIVKEEIQELDK